MLLEIILHFFFIKYLLAMLLTDLNIDTIVTICSFLDPKDLVKMMQVSKDMNKLTKSPRLWKKLSLTGAR